MARPPVTVAALAGADPQVTQAFLALLAETFVPGDHLVLCSPAYDPTAAGSWREMGLRTLARPTAAPAPHDVVVVVDERAVPVGPWLDPLVAATGDSHFGAAAARTNIAGGDELLVGVPYRPAETEVHGDLVRTRAALQHDELTAVECLGGPSLAVRRATLEDAGGLSALCQPFPIAALARRVADAGGRLAVAEGSYLHHGGGPAPWGPGGVPGPRPFVSACLITKDEHDNLPRCLASVEGFADEIVVYDTGSTDDTRDIARAAGATVVEGYWDGDFSRARNEALASCRGQWILWLDADEALVCDDRRGARHHLAELSSDAEALIVLIDNLRGTHAATALTHPACRLFRRAYGQWTGRVHEQVVARSGAPSLCIPAAEMVRITHWGYLRSTIGHRDKGRRNLYSAFGNLTAEAELPWASRLLSLGRSYGLAGRAEESLALSRAAFVAAEKPATRRMALRAVIETLMVRGQLDEALEEIAQLRSLLRVPSLADVLEGRALLALGRHEEALVAFERVVEAVDDDGYEYAPHGVAGEKALALAELGRHGAATEVLLDGLRTSGGMDVHVGILVDCLEAAGRPLAELARAVPADRAVAFLGQLANLEPERADRALEAWYGIDPSRAVLATVLRVAGGLPVDRLTTWSARLRADGLGHACPLVATVADAARPVADRLVGAAIATARFGDGRGQQAFGALCLQLPGSDRPGARDRLVADAPSLVAAFDALTATAVLPAPRATVEIAGADVPGPATPETAAPRVVLVVDRKIASLRTLAVARALRRHGHDVTVAHPQPASPSEAVLAPSGIDVRGWPAADEPGGWQRGLCGCVAALYAERPYDTIVVSADAGEVLADLRRILPAAHLVLDVDYGWVPEEDDSEPVDLVVTADPVVAARHPAASLFPVSAPSLFTREAGVPEALRRGVCVVGDFRTATGEELARFGRVAAELTGRGSVLSVALVGDDPDGRAAAALPGAPALGPLADPLPWLASARVVLVATSAGAAHWLSAAALCGTPALVVPVDDNGLDQVLPAIAALTDAANGSLWQRFALTADDEPAPGTADPLRRLPVPWRRRHGGAPPIRGTAIRGTSTRGTATRALRAAGAVAPAEVRRGCPPDLSPTNGGRLAVELVWPYGGVPVEWLGALRDYADEVRVPSSWAREHAIASGVTASLEVMAVTVDTELFAPHGVRRPLPTSRTSRLLFVGEATERDGLDAVLECYLTAFTADDDACLVVHLVGDGDPGWLDVRQAARRSPERPEVVLVEGLLADAERAALYRACDALVYCRRGAVDVESVLEAMATGLPVVTLDRGPARDLCDDRTGWLVGCREVAVDTTSLGLTPSPHGIWQLEPDRESLGAALRSAADAPHERLLKGLAARDRSATRFAAVTGRPAGTGSQGAQGPVVGRR